MLPDISHLFGFGLPVKEVFARANHPKTHVYLNEKDSTILGLNEYQAKLLKQLSGNQTDHFIGLKNSDFLFGMDLSNIIRNNTKVINSSTIQIFDEDILNYKILSIKTKLTNSANHIVGIIGISFELSEIGFSHIAEVINKLNITLALNSQPLAMYINNSQLKLSPREKECAFYLTRGMTAKEIARKMNISSRTVEFYLLNIKEKLGCVRRSEIVSKCLEDGLL